MSGQATVVAGSKQWAVAVVTTQAEITSGLSGVESLPTQTGMLFDLGYDYTSIPINMSQMLFDLDIIFISSTQGVVGILAGVKPSDSVAFSGVPGARYFLEVNAGEAEGVQVGDNVQISGYAQTGALDLSAIMQGLIATIVIVGMMGTLGKGVIWGREEHHSIGGPERQELVDLYGSWAVGRAEAVCPVDDVTCVEKEAARLLGAYRRGYSY